MYLTRSSKKGRFEFVHDKRASSLIEKAWFLFNGWWSVQLRSLSKHDVDGSENAIWRCNFSFLKEIFNIQSHYACKMCSNYAYSGMKLEYKIEHLSSYAQVVHTTTKQITSRRGKNENVCEMFKNESARAKRAKVLFSLSNMQICCRRRRGCLSYLLCTSGARFSIRPKNHSWNSDPLIL